ncbi:MAG: 50S ribosomal protein L2 [bacterium]|nr:50S ribosomal protein L2 [bacterium]
MKAYLRTSEPQKGLTTILKKHSGRDSTGTISVRHQGGRQKRYYRTIDFKRDKRGMEAKMVQIEYDPNRNAHIALVEYTDGEKRYILHPRNLNVGDMIISKEDADIKVGNALALKNIPIGIEIHNIELYPGQGGKMMRGAGTAAVVIAKEDKYIHIKLPSGEVRKIIKDCWATVGMVGNVLHKEEDLGKAGRKILKGIRPTVRGTAQNPRSHPHGGGEGRSGEGMHPKTPWGKPARGKRTRNRTKWSNKFIVKNRHTK